jgi:lipopolysaccharide/colanic/teichoic acid biosynthesis glycosyltransferase
VIAAPFIALVAVAVKMDSPGPVFFKQTRVGLNGRLFGCYKFRSMQQDAERMQENLETKNERSGPIFKIKDDPRRTRLGKFLRKYSVDEIPQLLNVLRGEMSLIGPRPPLPKEVAAYKPHHFRRLEVTPGITGLWQVTARDNKDFEVWVQLDVQYIESLSLGMDLWILLRTPLAILSAKGAS